MVMNQMCFKIIKTYNIHKT